MCDKSVRELQSTLYTLHSCEQVNILIRSGIRGSSWGTCIFVLIPFSSKMQKKNCTFFLSLTSWLPGALRQHNSWKVTSKYKQLPCSFSTNLFQLHFPHKIENYGMHWSTLLQALLLIRLQSKICSLHLGAVRSQHTWR